MENIFPVYNQLVQRAERENFLNQQSGVYWLTGLSGSGKTTIAKQVERMLFSEGYFVRVLDGDDVRNNLCKDLGFSLEDRKENIRRIAEVSRLLVSCGVICINTFVSPTIEIRNLAKEIIGKQDFHEIFIDTPLETCENRDVKGLYKKARNGEIKNFTGIDSPFESPSHPNLIISTNKEINDSSAELYRYIIQNVNV